MKSYLRDCGPIIRIDLNLNRYVPRQFFDNPFTRIFSVANGKILSDSFLNYDITNDFTSQYLRAVINYDEVYISYELLSLRCVALLINKKHFSEIFCIEDIDPSNHSKTIFNTTLPIQLAKHYKYRPLILDHHKPFSISFSVKLYQGTRILHDIGFYETQIREFGKTQEEKQADIQKLLDEHKMLDIDNEIFNDNFMKQILTDYENNILNDNKQVKTELITKIKRKTKSSTV